MHLYISLFVIMWNLPCLKFNFYKNSSATATGFDPHVFKFPINILLSYLLLILSFKTSLTVLDGIHEHYFFSLLQLLVGLQ